MLQFIKKLFGFGKKEDTTVISSETVTPVESNVTVAEAIVAHKEDVKFDENTGEVAINKSKEELEQVIAERLSEIESKKEVVDEAAPAVVEKKASKPKAPKAPKVEVKAESKPKKTTAKPKTEPAPKAKAKAAPKKDTKKGKK